MLLDMSTFTGDAASTGDGDLLSMTEAMKALGCSRRTLERWRSAGHIRGVKDPISRRVMFRADDVAALARRVTGEAVA